MEEAFRSGLFDKAPAKAAKESHNCKKEDVEFIVRRCNSPCCIFIHITQSRSMSLKYLEYKLREH